MRLNDYERHKNHMNWERFNELIALDQSGSTEEALAGFQELARTAEDPEDKAGILLAVSACQKELGRISEARSSLAEARSRAAKDSWIHPRALFRDASMDVRQGNWKGVLEKLDLLGREYGFILRDPEQQDLREEVRRYRGMALYELGEAQKAQPLLEEATTVDYEKPTSLYYLGRCCYDLGDLGKSRQCLCEALRLDLHPVFQPSAHYVLGLCYQWQGQPAWAVREFEWCLEHDAQGLVEKRKVLAALVTSLTAVGMEEDAARYSKVLRGLGD